MHFNTLTLHAYTASHCLCSNFLCVHYLGHSKDALDLAHVQETTKQLGKQEKIKVSHIIVQVSIYIALKV